MSKKASPPERVGDTPQNVDRRSKIIDPRLWDIAFEPVMVRNLKGEIAYWNKGASELYGYSPEEALGSISHTLLKTAFPLPLADLERQLERDGIWIGELVHTTKNGQKIIVESRHQLFDLGNGKQLVLETNRDITERKTLYRTLFEGMQHGVAYGRIVYDESGQPKDWMYLDVNPSLERLLGRTDLKGRLVSEIFPGLREKAPEIFEMYGRVARTGKPEVFEGYVEPLGKWIYISAFSPAKDHFIGIGKDISQRKQSDAMLRESESRFRSFFENAAIGAAQVNKQGRFIEVNDRMSQITGYSRNELLQMGPLELDHPDDVEADRLRIEAFFQSKAPYMFYEKRYVHKNGDVVWVRVTVAPVRDDLGVVVRTAALIEDITDRKKAENELTSLKSRLQHLISASPAVIYSCKPDGNFAATFISDNIVQQLGYTTDEFMNHSGFWAEHIHPDDSARVFANLPMLFESDQFVHEYRFRHKDGSYRWMLDKLRLVRDDEGKPLEIIGSWTDITDIKQSELERDKYTRMENLAQMHRLQIAGEFAALLAHQLNQPLTAIRSFAEAGIAQLRRGKMQPEQMHETLAEVVAQSERAAGSIRDLRKFLARQPLEMIQGDINAEVNAACSLMDVLARGRKVRIKTNLGNDLPKVSMRPSQIEQIIVNLIENAMDAINHTGHGEGEVEIVTRLDPSKDEIVVGVLDSGPGIDAATVGIVFDPLYTTKKNGIGMGLAISRSIISDHGGRIWAEPTPGGRFFFTLPVQ